MEIISFPCPDFDDITDFHVIPLISKKNIEIEKKNTEIEKKNPGPKSSVTVTSVHGAVAVPALLLVTKMIPKILSEIDGVKSKYSEDINVVKNKSKSNIFLPTNSFTNSSSNIYNNQNNSINADTNSELSSSSLTKGVTVLKIIGCPIGTKSFIV